MPVYKDGKKYYFAVYYYTPIGEHKKYKSKRFDTKKEAELAEASFISSKKDVSKISFDSVVYSFFNELETKRKASTVYTYRKDYRLHIEPYFSKLDLNKINIQTIRFWAEELLKKGLSVSYMNKVYCVLDSIMDYAVKNYGLSNNYAKIYGRFEEPNDKVVKDSDKLRYITYEEFQQLISVIDDPMYRMFFIFLYYTGVRKGEAFALTWEDIDFNSSVIEICKTLNNDIKGGYKITSNKTNTNRKIKMSSYLKQELSKYKELVKQYTDYREDWFVFGNTMPIPKTTADRYKHKYFKLSGVREITLHEFRHSHVSLLINEYVKTSKEKNVKVDMNKFFLMMSNRMGHSLQVMLDTYAHLSPDVMQDEIVDLLDNL